MEDETEEIADNPFVDAEPMICPVCGSVMDYDYWGVWCDNCKYKEKL